MYLVILEHIGKPVCAEQQLFRKSDVHIKKIHKHILFYTNCSCDNILIRMYSRCFPVNSSHVHHFFDKGVVFGDLRDKVVDDVHSAVSDIRHGHMTAVKRDCDKSRPHSFILAAVSGDLIDVRVGIINCFLQDILCIVLICILFNR